MRKFGILAGAAALALVATSAMAEPTFKNTYVQANLGTSLQAGSQDQRDSATNSGFAIGHDFRGWRLEGEYLNSYQTSNAGGTIGDVKGNFLFINGYVEPWTWYGFKPFVTAGIGYNWLSGTGTTGTKNGLAYNVGAGVSYSLSPVWTLSVDYRYITTDKKSVVNNAGNDERYVGNAVMGGLRYTF